MAIKSVHYSPTQQKWFALDGNKILCFTNENWATLPNPSGEDIQEWDHVYAGDTWIALVGQTMSYETKIYINDDINDVFQGTGYQQISPLADTAGYSSTPSFESVKDIVTLGDKIYYVVEQQAQDPNGSSWHYTDHICTYDTATSDHRVPQIYYNEFNKENWSYYFSNKIQNLTVAAGTVVAALTFWADSSSVAQILYAGTDDEGEGVEYFRHSVIKGGFISPIPNFSSSGCKALALTANSTVSPQFLMVCQDNTGEKWFIGNDSFQQNFNYDYTPALLQSGVTTAFNPLQILVVDEGTFLIMVEDEGTLKLRASHDKGNTWEAVADDIVTPMGAFSGMASDSIFIRVGLDTKVDPMLGGQAVSRIYLVKFPTLYPQFSEVAQRLNVIEGGPDIPKDTPDLGVNLSGILTKDHAYTATIQVDDLTGIAAGDLEATLVKNGVPEPKDLQGAWGEIDAGNLPGLYMVGLSATDTDTLGDLLLHIKVKDSPEPGGSGLILDHPVSVRFAVVAENSGGGSGDLTPVLNSLDEIKGAGFTSGTDSLVQVRGLVEGIDTSDLAGIKAETDKIQGIKDDTTSIDAKVDALDLDAITGSLNDLKARIGFDSPGPGNNVEDALDAIEVDVDLSGIEQRLDALAGQAARILGLSQENFRITGHQYTSTQKLGQASIQIFDNAADTQTGNNPIASYTLRAQYDVNGLLIDYQVTKDSSNP